MDLTGKIIRVSVEEKISKAGNKYTVLEIEFANGYIKSVFLEQAEYYLVQSLANTK